MFHVMFKAAALLIYLFGTWFTSNFVFLFVVCVLLLAFDFWTVKVRPTAVAAPTPVPTAHRPPPAARM